MFEHSETVELAGKEYPIRCDINVLAEIQEQFGAISDFEMLIAGVKIKKDKNGNPVMGDGNRVQFERGEPSAKAIGAILPCMLREACGSGLDEALDAVRNARFELYKTALQMHKELDKCFERKNA